jgi:hypothetical protein
MTDKNQPEIHAAAGPQDFLKIRRSKAPKTGYEIEVLGPDKAHLYSLESAEIRDKTSIVVMLAQEMSRDKNFGFGRDQLPYRWTGNHWMPVERWLTSLDYSMHALIRTAVNRRMTSDSLAFEALSAWQANSTYPLEGLDLRAFGDCPGIPFSDNVLTLSPGSWKVEPHAAKYFNTRVLSLNANTAGECYIGMSMGSYDDLMLVKFLRSTLDEEQQIVFRRWLGYHLVSGRIPNAEKMLYLWGSGGNGKSQLLWLIRSLLGIDACAELRLPDLRVSANIEKLVGKVAMIGSEATTGTDLETLKSLISREPLNCNPKYRDPFTVTPECLVSQSSNYPPEFGEKSDAMMRRTVALHLKSSFLDDSTRKEDIAQAIIKEEYALLVGLALWGAEELIDAGRFFIPAAITQQSNEAVAGGNQVHDLADVLEFGPYEIAMPELYDCYVRWCRDEGRTRNMMPRKTLLAEVERLAGSRKRIVMQHKKATHYEPQHWVDDIGHRALVHPKLTELSRIDIICGVRVRADAFGAAVGQAIPASRQRAHLFADAPPLAEAA